MGPPEKFRPEKQVPGKTAPKGQPSKKQELPAAVLFACNMNAIRSPMAAALLNFLAGPNCYVRSAGVRVGNVDPFTIEVMKEIGIDMTAHEPVAIHELSDSYFDLIITLTPEAHHQALELTHYMAVDVQYWPTLDPALVTGNRDQRLDSYRSCRDKMLKQLKGHFSFSGCPSL